MKAVIQSAAVVAVLLAGSAFAHETVRLREARERGPDSDVELKLQGGMVTYTGDAARLTSPGPAYGVLAATDLFGPVDGELSYQGAAYTTDLDLGNQTAILENGGQGLLMLSPTFGRVEPYVFTGLGVDRLSVLDDAATRGLVHDATLVRLPLGVGVDWVPAGDGGGEADLLIGARVKYDLALSGDAFSGIDDRMNANQLQTTLQVGASF